MNRASNRHQLRLITQISVTPLLDLVLILLFVFVMTAPLLKKDAALAAPVPSPSEAPTLTVTLALDIGGAVKLEGAAAIPSVQLPATLKKLVAEKPDAGVIVQTPPDLPVHKLVEVMTMLKEAGVKHTAVSATPERP